MCPDGSQSGARNNLESVKNYKCKVKDFVLIAKTITMILSIDPVNQWETTEQQPKCPHLAKSTQRLTSDVQQGEFYLLLKVNDDQLAR